MLCIGPTQYVAGIFQYSMLKTIACAEERASLLASKTDCPRCALGVAIGAGGDAPETVKTVQGRGAGERVGVEPLHLDAQAQGGGGLLQRQRDSLVGDHIRVVVADQGEVQGAGSSVALGGDAV